MHFAYWALLPLAALTVCSCTSVDMDGMDETFHNTTDKQAAALAAQDDREARQEAQAEYYSNWGGQTPYDYYRSRGYSEKDAQNLADKAQAPP